MPFLKVPYFSTLRDDPPARCATVRISEARDRCLVLPPAVTKLTVDDMAAIAAYAAAQKP